MSDWRFLLDENVDPKVATYLGKEGQYAEHVRDVLGQGAEDEEDLLPYARTHDLVVVTSDVSDFASLPDEAHAGVILLYDDTLPAYRAAEALLDLIEAYPSRTSFTDREILDEWV